MLHSHYGGRMEEFCRPHCMSQYTIFYYGVRTWKAQFYCTLSYIEHCVSLLLTFFSLSSSFYSPVQMGRCDSCRKQSYMTEKLQCLGSVRNFCNLPCLLQYCYLHFEMSQHSSSNGTGTAPQTPYGKFSCQIGVI